MPCLLIFETLPKIQRLTENCPVVATLIYNHSNLNSLKAGEHRLLTELKRLDLFMVIKGA